MTVEGPGTTAYLELGFHAVRTTDPDYYPLVVLDTILGGAKGMSMWGGGTANRSSRLYKALVETELASDVDCAVSSTVDPFMFSFEATVREGRTLDEVEHALLAEIQRVIDEPVSEAELHKAIKQTRAQFAYSSESVTDQGYWLGFSEIVADVSWFENYLDRLAAVTVEDVQRVAQTYFKPSLRNVGRYVPVGDGDTETGDTATRRQRDTATRRWRAMMRRSSMMKLNNPGFASLLPTSPRPRVAASALPGPDDVLRTTLPNGVTVLARENWSAPSVVVEGYLLAGSLDEPVELPGLASFTVGMFEPRHAAALLHRDQRDGRGGRRVGRLRHRPPHHQLLHEIAGRGPRSGAGCAGG